MTKLETKYTVSLSGTACRSCWQENPSRQSSVTENSNMPQEISLKRGKQENNSLALFTDISQESPVIRNAVAQSMTSSSLLTPTLTSPFFFFSFLQTVALTQSQSRCFVSTSLPHVPAAMHSGGGDVSAGTGRNTENGSTHNYIALPSPLLDLISTLLFHSHEKKTWDQLQWHAPLVSPLLLWSIIDDDDDDDNHNDDDGCWDVKCMLPWQLILLYWKLSLCRN